MCGAWTSAAYNLEVVGRIERATHVVRLDQPDYRGAYRSLRATGRQRHHHRPENRVTTEYETHDHDVLIIGAGGAGLPAALGALAEGARVGGGSKSLLGQAHNVMGEGGIAAAM